jgi:hypothetical protein
MLKLEVCAYIQYVCTRYLPATFTPYGHCRNERVGWVPSRRQPAAHPGRQLACSSVHLSITWHILDLMSSKAQHVGPGLLLSSNQTLGQVFRSGPEIPKPATMRLHLMSARNTRMVPKHVRESPWFRLCTSEQAKHVTSLDPSPVSASDEYHRPLPGWPLRGDWGWGTRPCLRDVLPPHPSMEKQPMCGEYYYRAAMRRGTA